MSASKRRPVPASEGGPQFAIHLTPASNLESIGRHGLLPSIGPLAKLAGEMTPRVYLYGSVTEFSRELLQWMGNILALPGDDGRTPIALLAVDVTHTDAHSYRGDHACSSEISADCLDVVTFDLDADTDLQELMDGYCERRFTAQMLGRHSESSWRELPLLARHAQMLEAGAVHRTRISRRGVESREDVAQVSLFPVERPFPRN